MLNQIEVGIIGGGASGMFAALFASQNGAKVTILECADRVGKKLLATGNGKCNFSNKEMNENFYYGSDKAFIHNVLQCFSLEDTLNMFQSLGLMITDKRNYLYPASEQASVVLDVLRIALKSQNVECITGVTIQKIEKRENKKRGENRFQVITSDNTTYSFDKIILATGSMASTKYSFKDSGYQLAKAFGHRITPLLPALVSLHAEETYFKAIAGVRADARVSFLENGEVLATQRGEVQFTDYGISGIPVFQISRIANQYLMKHKKLIVCIDCAPDRTKEELLTYIKQNLITRESCTVEELFTGMLHKKLMLQFIKLAGLSPNAAAKSCDANKRKQIVSFMKELTITVIGSHPMQSAQVCAGGVPTEEIDENMESKLVKGLYFCGEILDVDGMCGGYNLQWAWSTGAIAGRAAAKVKSI